MDDGAQNRSAAELFRSTHATLILMIAYGYGVNETSHFCKNNKLRHVVPEKRERRAPHSAPECNESPRDVLLQRGQERVVGACERSRCTVKSLSTGSKIKKCGYCVPVRTGRVKALVKIKNLHKLF